MTDKIFEKSIVKQFEFDEEVASVFDDMLSRSIPYYKAMQKLSINLAKNYLEDGSVVYDLGCSTASTLIELAKSSEKNLKLIGVDNSIAMLQRAEKKAKAFGVSCEFLNEDILSLKLQNSRLIVANYTLQFIRPMQREKVVQNIYSSLEDGGAFIFCEKVISSDSVLNKQYIDEYYDFKKQNGYSDFEIAQKREALENVLIPYTQEENVQMIKNAGFSHCEVVFKWVNFAMFIAVK